MGFATSLGCEVTGVFACQENLDCRRGAIEGICDQPGFCSFLDLDCPSQRRFGEHAGSLSGTCVDSGSASTGVATAAPGSTSMSETTMTGGDTIAPSSGPGVDSTSSGTTTRMASDDTSGQETGAGVDPDLLLWLTFDESVTLNDGTVGFDAGCEARQCPTLAAGVVGSGARFDGVDDCLRVGDHRSFASESGTVALWVLRETEAGPLKTAIGKPLSTGNANSWAIYWHTFQDPEGRLYGALNTEATSASLDAVLAPTDTWVHVALVWDGSEGALWVNGMLTDTVAAPTPSYADEPIWIGCDDDHEGMLEFHITGSLDDVRVYRRALEPAELAALIR